MTANLRGHNCWYHSVLLLVFVSDYFLYHLSLLSPFPHLHRPLPAPLPTTLRAHSFLCPSHVHSFRISLLCPLPPLLLLLASIAFATALTLSSHISAFFSHHHCFAIAPTLPLRLLSRLVLTTPFFLPPFPHFHRLYHRSHVLFSSYFSF